MNTNFERLAWATSGSASFTTYSDTDQPVHWTISVDKLNRRAEITRNNVDCGTINIGTGKINGTSILNKHHCERFYNAVNETNGIASVWKATLIEHRIVQVQAAAKRVEELMESLKDVY